MPVHDWTRVSAATYHPFHNLWIGMLQDALNNGGLPESYYALGEQRTGRLGPDLLTLQELTPAGDRPDVEAGPPGVAVAEAPPKVSIVAEMNEETAFFLRRQRSLVIRHSSGNRIVAIVEIVSPGNKHSRASTRRFVEKILVTLENGVHFLLVDLFPPSNFDPEGIHGLLWEYAADESYVAPPGKPLALAAYRAGEIPTAYVEPLAVGAAMIAMPLFLTEEHYVEVPLQTTYDRALHGMPRQTRRTLAETLPDGTAEVY